MFLENYKPGNPFEYQISNIQKAPVQDKYTIMWYDKYLSRVNGPRDLRLGAFIEDGLTDGSYCTIEKLRADGQFLISGAEHSIRKDADCLSWNCCLCCII